MIATTCLWYLCEHSTSFKFKFNEWVILTIIFLGEIFYSKRAVSSPRIWDHSKKGWLIYSDHYFLWGKYFMTKELSIAQTFIFYPPKGEWQVTPSTPLESAPVIASVLPLCMSLGVQISSQYQVIFTSSTVGKIRKTNTIMYSHQEFHMCMFGFFLK